MSLPKICNLNPRSIYNKIEEFKVFIQEEQVDCVFISESWERENLLLEDIINLSNFEVVSNVSQRKGGGGRPAIVVNHEKFDVLNITNTLVQIPWGVEAVWAILTPKQVNFDSKIRNIACCAFYSPPGSNQKKLLLDHFSDAYNLISKKYNSGLEFIIAGDANHLKLNSILNLNPRFCQIVRDYTRLNPPALLDPVVTTMSSYYQVPKCLPPLDPDDEVSGKKSDHLIVIAEPISEINNSCGRDYKTVTTRPISKTGISLMKHWMMNQTWSDVYSSVSAHKKAEVFNDLLIDAFERFFPEKTKQFCNNDQPWMTCKLKDLDRKRKRIYHRERRSAKWKMLNSQFKREVRAAKANFYESAVKDLKSKNPRQWYSSLKRITSQNSERFQVNVDEINHLTDLEQAEVIAEKFTSVKNMYEKLKVEDIEVPDFKAEDIPQFGPSKIWRLLTKLKTNKATIEKDFPPKLAKLFAAYIAEPLTDVLNTSIRRGEYPNLYKSEISTPVPKKYPPKSLSDLRNISGLRTFDKVFENLLAEMMINDMKPKMDKSQYGNRKGVSIQHYLVKMINQILTALDNSNHGEKKAVLVSLIDWDNAFPRQCPILGIKSFIQNGVRPALIPVLLNFFQDRQMAVKWRGCKSQIRELNGGCPQGGSLGILDFISQSNDCANVTKPTERFRFIDDLSLLEIINLLTVGMCSLNFRNQVSSNIGIHNQFIPPDYLQSQNWLDSINLWTKNQKGLINSKKTKFMVFNFTENHQFSTNLTLEGHAIEEVSEVKLLGTVITNDLKWDKNTSEIVRKANARMELLRRLSAFNVDVQDLKTIYILFVRSQLEQSAVVWHSSLTEENAADLERVQKTAMKIILGEKYQSYKKSLNYLGLETLEERRKSLCLRFALKSLENENEIQMFSLNEKVHTMKTRNSELLQVQHANTSRLKNSILIYMQNIVNEFVNTRK